MVGDGLHGEAEQYALYVQMLENVGLSLAEVQAYTPLPTPLGAAAAIGYFRRSSFEEGLGTKDPAVSVIFYGSAPHWVAAGCQV